jgi:AraC-like DNA-binding protein
VNVLAFLGSSAHAHLIRALPPPHRITHTTDWPTLLSALRDGRCDVAVVDPCVGGPHANTDRLRELADAARASTETPVVGYFAVSAAAIRAAHTFARFGPPDVSNIVVRGFDDALDTLSATLHRVVSASAASRLVLSVGNPFAALPPAAARAVVTLFHHPERMRSVSDLAAEARTTRRSLDRWLAQAGLASARTLLVCARANAAFHLMTAGHVRAARAADMLGYASPRALAREMQALTGYAPSTIRGQLTASAFSAAIAHRLRRAPVIPRRPAY